MNLKMKVYYLLINRVPGIRTKYNNYRKHNQGIKRVKAWCYLMGLNVRYYILREHNLGEEILYPDKNKKIVKGSESKIEKRMTPEELVRKLCSYDVISFDVFDTLLLRQFRLPEDVFYLLQKKLHYINLKSIRMDAEWRARQKRYQEHGDYEVTLAEIWDQVCFLTSIDHDEGVRTEIEAEHESCYANPYFLKVFKLLIDEGKTIVLCSDMYLGSDQILKLLEKCGYPLTDHCFISCDYRKSKATGELYEVVKQKMGSELRYVHIGDNEYSDVTLAKKHGYDAMYYQKVQDVGEKYRAMDMSDVVSSIYSGIVNAYLHNGLTEKSALYEFGYIYGGLFVVGYCQYIHEFVKNNSIEKILFLSRDGDVLQKAYCRLYPEEAEKTAYALWSRLAATKLSAHRFKTLYIERMIYHKTNQGYSFGHLFETMGITPLLDDFLNSSQRELNAESVLDTSLLQILLDFINSNWERILEFYKDELEEGEDYYSQLLQGAKSTVVVDVGWVGSGAISLKQLIEFDWDMNCKVYGVVAGSCSATGVDKDTTAIEYATGEISSYLFSAADNRDVWKIHDASKGHNMIVELLLSSNQKSFRGFKKNSEGEYDFNDSSETIDADIVQEGILDFVEQFKKHPLHNVLISGRDAMAPILLLYQNEEYMKEILYDSGIKANIE